MRRRPVRSAAGADDISQLDDKALRAIPGVGASIAAKIAEYRDTGSIRALEELRGKIPPGVLELTRVPGLGPKRALQLSHDLGVASVDDLAAAIKAGRLDGLAGFGAKSGERIARLAHPGRRDQHLAAGQAARLSPQRPLSIPGDYLIGTIVLHDPDNVLLKQGPDPIGASLP